MTDPLVDAAFAAGRVPESVSRDYLNESRDLPAIIGIILVFVLTGLVVSARTWSRVFILKRFGFDDGLAIFSFVSWSPFLDFLFFFLRFFLLLPRLRGEHYLFGPSSRRGDG
jgi:hypothetical protein